MLRIGRHRGNSARTKWTLILLLAAAALMRPAEVRAQSATDRMRDRGPGIPTSMFGTYVERGQFIFYPFFEYYRDSNLEYKPSELGYGVDVDYLGKYRASEGLIFLGYGFSDRLAVEFEAAIITARLEKAANDPSTMPPVLEESGLGDVEGQLRWRWNRETERRPEVFSYFETVLPLQKKRKLIGTQHLELKLGTGVVRGYAWGTMTVRAAVEYDGGDNSVAPGEVAVEYLKRLSSRLRVYAGVEADQDEVALITEAQVFVRRNIMLKLNNAIGVTSLATDWAPEVGIMISWP